MPAPSPPYTAKTRCRMAQTGRTRQQSKRRSSSAIRVLLRRRQLVADGVPIELGTRAFDLLLVLLQADGSLVTKDDLLSRVWPGIVVADENLKVQISALRRALGRSEERRVGKEC